MALKKATINPDDEDNRTRDSALGVKVKPKPDAPVDAFPPVTKQTSGSSIRFKATYTSPNGETKTLNQGGLHGNSYGWRTTGGTAGFGDIPKAQVGDGLRDGFESGGSIQINFYSQIYPQGPFKEVGLDVQ